MSHLAVIAYIAVTIFGTWFYKSTVNLRTELKLLQVVVVTIKEFGGPVLKDSRFVLGRGGMVTNAVMFSLPGIVRFC